MTTTTETTEQKVLNPIDELLPLIAMSVEEWKAKNTEEVIRKKVFDHLDQAANTIVMKLLGFNTRYNGEWELDHCNGRAGNSTAGDYLRNVQQKAINEWLSNVTIPEMTPALKKTLDAEIKSQYKRDALYSVRDMVADRVKTDLQQLISAVVKSNDFTDYQKMLNLLGVNQGTK